MTNDDDERGLMKSSEDIEVGITKKPSLSRNKISTSWRREVTTTCKMTRGLMMYDDDV